MNTGAKSIYDRIRLHVEPNAQDLDGEFQRLPMLIMEASECAATSVSIREHLDFAYKVAFANACETLRNPPEGKKPPEEAIKANALSEPDVHTTWAAFEAAQEDCRMWAALVDALKAKKGCLDRLADFHLSGWGAPSAASHVAGREALNGARTTARARVKEGAI